MDFDGTPLADLCFESIGWATGREHVEQRAVRKSTPEFEPAVEWATEACSDPRRLVGRTSSAVYVIGFSPSCGRLLRVVLQPLGHANDGDWLGLTAHAARRTGARAQAVRGGAMTRRTRAQVKAAIEAAQSELQALDELDAADVPAPVRALRQPKDPAQVYSVRVPVAQLEQLRTLAEARGETPSGLMRRWVVERLVLETTGSGSAGSVTFEAIQSAIDRAVTQALVKRGLLELAPGSVSPDVEDPRYLDPSGPVRLGATRRLATGPGLAPVDAVAR